MINETTIFVMIGKAAAQSSDQEKAELIELFASYVAGNGVDSNPLELLKLATKHAKVISRV